MNTGSIGVLSLPVRQEIDCPGSIIGSAFPDFTIASRRMEDDPQGAHIKASGETARPKTIDFAEAPERSVETTILPLMSDREGGDRAEN